jgi:type II secretory pathway pseudopilin PulG
MPQSKHPSKLDMFHKGVYPGIVIMLMFFSVAFTVFNYWNSNDKQRQIDRLQAQMQLVQAQQQEQDRRAEEDAHNMRVEMCRLVLSHEFEFSNSPAELKTEPDIKTSFAHLRYVLVRKDMEQFGEDRAKELWDKAQKQAEKEVKKERIDWGDL